MKLAPIAFDSYEFKHGNLAELDEQYPTGLSAFSDALVMLNGADTHFGYVFEHQATLITADRREHAVPAGYAFSVHGPANIDARGGGRGIVISRRGFKGFNYITGPVEQEGRLKYIDGCTDSLLIPPVRMGDPCLNLLYFPPGIDQTAHTHPSERVGIILSGRGRCHAWDVDFGQRLANPRDDEEYQEKLVDLTPGMIFAIHTNGKHKFSTPYGEPMRVLAYHPESDFGPRDEDHPMINRTIVEGRSAREIDEIRTK